MLLRQYEIEFRMKLAVPMHDLIEDSSKNNQELKSTWLGYCSYPMDY